MSKMVAVLERRQRGKNSPNAVHPSYSVRYSGPASRFKYIGLCLVHSFVVRPFCQEARDTGGTLFQVTSTKEGKYNLAFPFLVQVP